MLCDNLLPTELEWPSLFKQWKRAGDGLCPLTPFLVIVLRKVGGAHSRTSLQDIVPQRWIPSSLLLDHSESSELRRSWGEIHSIPDSPRASKASLAPSPEGAAVSSPYLLFWKSLVGVSHL